MARTVGIGIQEFSKIRENDYFYIDKSLFIKEWWESGDDAVLITRPRRFGKTLNMDMLRVFFEKTKEDNSIYFKDKLIWKCGDEYTSFQGKFPVIFLSFKDVKCNTWDLTYEKICKLITLEFLRHHELEHSKQLNTYEKEFFILV